MSKLKKKPFVKLTILKNLVRLGYMFPVLFKVINKTTQFKFKSQNLKKVCIGLVTLILILSLTNINTFAAACPSTTKISLTDIFQFTKFIPIIPKECSGQALDLQDAGTVLLRLYGFIASLIWYLVSFIVIFSGMMWIWDGIDGNQAAQAKKNLADAAYALLIVFSTFIIINTILGLIGGANLITGIGKFFQ